MIAAKTPPQKSLARGRDHSKLRSVQGELNRVTRTRRLNPVKSLPQHVCCTPGGVERSVRSLGISRDAILQLRSPNI
jgi:hypothetical protein